MKTPNQLIKITAKAFCEGYDYIVSNDKYGDFHLYKVYENRLSWCNTFHDFQQFLDNYSRCQRNGKYMFVPYLV